MKRYLVTGATGFVGGVLARRLREAGHHVVTIARDRSHAGALARDGVEVHAGDITDRASLAAPMAGVDGVFHLAAWYKLGLRDVSEAERTNVEGTRNVLETMRELRVPKGVYTSSLAVFSDTRGRRPDESYVHRGPHLSEYDRTKWLAHYEVALPMMRAGLPLVIVQPGLIYGPGDTGLPHQTLTRYLQRRLPMVPKGAAYCWTHIGDAVEAHRLAFDRGRPGESYIVGGPPHSIEDALLLAERITGIPGPAFHAGPRLLRALSAIMRVVGAGVSVPPDASAEMLRVLAGATYLGDNTKAREELGYAPRTLVQGLRETLEHEMRALGMPVPGTRLDAAGAA
jgi:nucleoside-diphosphate-sugar epimerase